MNLNRRELLKFASWLAAMPLFPVANARQLPAESEFKAEVQLEAAAIDFFVKQGYHPVPALPLITGEQFNGGLRYDDTPSHYPSGKMVRLQGSLRLEDLERRGEWGTLPFFHILSLSIEKPASRGELLVQVLAYLVQSADLDPKRLLLVSTKRFEPYLALLQPFGISREQFVKRDLSEAIAAGDGSGYFRPEGHPTATGIHTVSIHYTPDSDVSGLGKSCHYPYNGSLELAEISIVEAGVVPIPREVGGFGLERLLMAQGKPIDSFLQSRQKALTAILAESERRGDPLPAGYQTIKSA
jgi:hypothetical protein